jgi:predicted fused transcriptional regulator/phosphomethylpyrimidine kinase
LHSPYGRRGSICAHLGWTWDYLHHEIAWNIVQRILIDAPSVDYDEGGGKDHYIEVTNENAREVLDKINRIKR